MTAIPDNVKCRKCGKLGSRLLLELICCRELRKLGRDLMPDPQYCVDGGEHEIPEIEEKENVT